ncbi:MAG: ribonuclease Z [Bacteroidetes bacterium]|nr:ribonuclease Z [Bacteroidota bacterium]HET6244302.1 MBL fold metallo-hydrolase [Bacteroidia bacterium]
MNIKFLGFGGAFDYKHGNSSAIINIDNKTILVDCGYSVFPRLRKLNISEEIDYVFITHLHDDHAGSLSSFLIYRKLFSTPVKLVFPDLEFKNTLEAYLSHSLQTPNKYFDFIDIKETAFADYINTKDFHVRNMQTYSYIFSEKSKKIVFSGDINNPEYLINQLEKKGISKSSIFCDITFDKTNKAHAFYKDIQEKYSELDITGYHYDPKKKPKDCKVKLVGEQPELLF